jgi:hypothetical protein
MWVSDAGGGAEMRCTADGSNSDEAFAEGER